MYFPRLIQKHLENQINSKEIVVLTGMRRTGKTTLMRYLYEQINTKNKVYLDLDNIIEQKIFEEQDFNNIWFNLKPFGIKSSEKSFIFIDEIQAMPSAVKAVKYLYDHYNVKFFITGSSSFYIKNVFPESLAGRKVIFELFPLTFREFLIFKNSDYKAPLSFRQMADQKNFIAYEKLKKYFDEYLHFGGFPQIVLEEDEEQKKLQIKDIFQSYFEKDVQKLADFRNLNIFRDMILLLMQRAGSKLDITKLASELRISRDTVYSYLNFLEATYFISLISPFSRNVDREVSGTKKVYVCDTGILNNFARVSDGVLIENAVYNLLRIYGQVKYYQKRGGSEIDFILFPEKIAFEVKMNGNENDIKKLKRLADNLDIKEHYVVSYRYLNNPEVILAQDL